VADRIISEVFVRDDWLEGLVKHLEVGAEEVRLNLRKLIELYESILKHSFILLIEGLRYNSGHERQKLHEFLGVFALSDGNVVGEGLEGSDFNIQFLELECPLEDATKLVLVLHQVVKNVAEEPVEDLESGVDLSRILPLNEGEELVE